MKHTVFFMFHVKQLYKFVFHMKHCFFLFYVSCETLSCACFALLRFALRTSQRFAFVLPYVKIFRRRPPRLPCAGDGPIFNFQSPGGIAVPHCVFPVYYPLALVLLLFHRGRGGDLPAACPVYFHAGNRKTAWLTRCFAVFFVCGYKIAKKNAFV